MAQNDLHLQNFSDMIWSVADMLRGSFQEDDYGRSFFRSLFCVESNAH